jgi:hypothetical protein
MKLGVYSISFPSPIFTVLDYIKRFWIESEQNIAPVIRHIDTIYGRSYHHLKTEGITRIGVPIKKEQKIVPGIKIAGSTTK